MENNATELPENQSSNEVQYGSRKTFWDTNRTLLKSLLVGFLTLIMLIPASFIKDLVYERESRQQQVIAEVSSKWALEQTVKGPIIMIPYWAYVTQADKSVLKTRKAVYVMPEQLNVKGQLNPEVRHRSIYDVTLYKSKLNVDGSFKAVDLAQYGISPEQIIENEVKVLLGVDDVRGLEQDITLNLNSENLVMDAGLPTNDFISRGLSRSIVWDRSKPLSFSFGLQLKGSGNLSFVPIGKTTKVNISSPWQHPSFIGKFIPSESADINTQGFNANWSILQISSGIPSLVTDQSVNLDESAFGVRLIQPTDGYAKTQRSVKYALLFISLTFTVFFFIEVLQKRQIHPLQYLLVGLALCVFYTLLLSFTEYAGFNLSYGVSSCATVCLIGSYVWGVFKSGKIAGTFVASLAALYGYIFVLIQLEDLALLFGSIGLFFLLAVIMFYSRKIDWYGTLRTGKK